MLLLLLVPLLRLHFAEALIEQQTTAIAGCQPVDALQWHVVVPIAASTVKGALEASEPSSNKAYCWMSTSTLSIASQAKVTQNYKQHVAMSAALQSKAK